MKRKDPPVDLGGSSSKTSKPNVDRPLPPAPLVALPPPPVSAAPPVAPPPPPVPAALPVRPEAPAVNSLWFMANPESFVTWLLDYDQCFHVLMNMKRWMVHPDWKTSTIPGNNLAFGPPTAMDDFPRAVRDPTLHDRIAISRARQMFHTQANTGGERFIWETMLRLRFRLKGKGYLRRKHGYLFPYKVRFSRYEANDYDWLDYESGDDEGVFVGRDEEADEDLYQFGDGSTGYFDYKGDRVIISSPEDRVEMGLDFY